MKIFDGIISRPSVRLHNFKPIEIEIINQIIEPAIWAILARTISCGNLRI